MIKKFWQSLDKNSNPQRLILWFLLIWLIINLVQAYFTGLAHDEAYYWMYSRNLAWGYFDHPPMIALFVKAGYAIFPNSLGVRFFPAILGALVLFIVYQLLKKDLTSVSLFFALILTIVLMQTHIGGFLAIPDLPLVFFAALFFLVYKHYQKKDSYKLAIILGLVGAAMLYSKYHGVLVLFFTLISNLKLLRRLSFWIIPVIIVAAMIPHLMWQIENEFPTFGYHLVGRSSAYSIDRTLNYILGQLLITGPFLGVMYLYHSAKVKINGDLFLKAMKFNFYGFFGFFLLSSFKGHVEPHWTAIGFIPLLVLSYHSIKNSGKAQKWVRAFVVPSVVLVLLFRFALAVDTGLLPKTIPAVKEFYYWDEFSEQVKEFAGDRKVVFTNTFQRPSIYAFSTGGDFTHTLNSIHYRLNQYDIWGLEENLQGEDVLLLGMGKCPDTLKTVVGEYPYRKIDNFKSYYNIKIATQEKEFNLGSEESVEIETKIINTRDYLLKFESSDPKFAPRLCLTYHDGKKFLKPRYLQYLTDSIPVGDTLSMPIKIAAPEKEGTYSCYISIVNDRIYPSYNSGRLKVIVK